MLLAAYMPAAAQQTKLLTAEKHNEYGLVYTLPVTALDIEVTAVREVKKAGSIINMPRNMSAQTRLSRRMTKAGQ